MIEDKCIDEEFFMKHFEQVNSRKRAMDEEDFQNFDQPSPKFDYGIAYNALLVQVPFEEVVLLDWDFIEQSSY